MTCVFCRQTSVCSTNVEHIIPESLGNKRHVLPKGVVCDACNNYFAVKIEKEVLQLPYFVSVRGRHAIENKKGKIPGVPAFIRHPQFLGEINARFHENLLEIEVNNQELRNAIIQGEYRKLFLPYLPEPPQNNVLLSRFLGKIALEALAERLMCAKGWGTQIIENEAIDELRDYVRFGKGAFWHYHQRRIYSESETWSDVETGEPFQILHEYDFLIPDKPEVEGDIHHLYNLYFVCAIMGIEYAFNLTGHGLGRYVKWLEENDNRSILQMEKEQFNFYSK